jgi:hypothetical protein
MSRFPQSTIRYRKAIQEESFGKLSPTLAQRTMDYYVGSGDMMSYSYPAPSSPEMVLFQPPVRIRISDEEPLVLNFAEYSDVPPQGFFFGHDTTVDPDNWPLIEISVASVASAFPLFETALPAENSFCTLHFISFPAREGANLTTFVLSQLDDELADEAQVTEFFSGASEVRLTNRGEVPVFVYWSVCMVSQRFVNYDPASYVLGSLR